ncbi:DNA-protecting protein DprA [Streptomyces sp. N2-109]|uniref:DNA-protecting protein DprA n=1 Tax=Streptomyces gossypii TaxID=2883101 RepID=A0ABT2JPI5_9ACTN|nr:DNA-processing protein DprA [Streptomyces gossypii]MCT2589429.1 DNA-protecting protein DprA [Streptomyces gossypii]
MDGICLEQENLLTLCALHHESATLDWQLVARVCQSRAGLEAMLAGDIPEESAAARKSLPVLRGALTSGGLDAARSRVAGEVEAAGLAGARMVTVLDDAYPANLRPVPNLPPFLFHRGPLQARDVRSVAVVGTRDASADGLSRAARMAEGLTQEDVVVVSGLAKGIDAAAHQATLDVGGRTVAVMGTGIAAPVYPAQNRPLADRILSQGGALVSQFWPTSSPARWTFPRRNVVTSGYTRGSVVIEASSTSGAKMQARIAAEHGKQVFLLRSLIAAQPWAAKMIDQKKAVEVTELDDVLRHLGRPEPQHPTGQQQIQLALAGV